MARHSRMIESFIGECPKCHTTEEWVRTEADRQRLQERGETGAIGVRREVTVSVNRRLFVARCSCGGMYVHRRVLGNEDALANARLAKDIGGAVNPLTGMATPVVPRYEWKSIDFQEFLREVRFFWGRKDKETLREGLAREGVHVAPFKEAVAPTGNEPPPAAEAEEAGPEEEDESPSAPPPSKRPFPRPST